MCGPGDRHAERLRGTRRHGRPGGAGHRSGPGHHRYSGFYGTDLEATLRRLGTTSLIVTGCTTSVCVESTIRDAFFRDYLPVLLADCTSEPLGRANHEASLAVIEHNLGWVSDSKSLLAALTPVP
ncbi:cysteine hydrolase family protein [Saccharopolyspora elongata]|uniref:cysteine hydrolase family protein n=1 Tax=Saccharopolyspora elongata TaxID=2530387 RepID=UPI001F2D88DC|nr:cysteine hydrolase [Saccharopolyspora elongata]